MAGRNISLSFAEVKKLCCILHGDWRSLDRQISPHSDYVRHSAAVAFDGGIRYIVIRILTANCD